MPTYTCLGQGGPEEAGRHPSRTLVLMWADYMGWGTYGLRCLEAYEGEHLILVGEWRTDTYGSFAPGMSENGQSFSLEMQLVVEENFDLVRTVDLPNWPMSLDKVRLYRRRGILQRSPAP